MECCNSSQNLLHDSSSSSFWNTATAVRAVVAFDFWSNDESSGGVGGVNGIALGYKSKWIAWPRAWTPASVLPAPTIGMRLFHRRKKAASISPYKKIYNRQNGKNRLSYDAKEISNLEWRHNIPAQYISRVAVAIREKVSRSKKHDIETVSFVSLPWTKKICRQDRLGRNLH